MKALLALMFFFSWFACLLVWPMPTIKVTLGIIGTTVIGIGLVITIYGF